MSEAVDSILVQLEEEVTCSICLQVFTDPYTLDCMHSFCNGCLSDLINVTGPSTITCPTCRAPAFTFKPDFRSNRLTEVFLEMQKKRSGRSCQLCEMLNAEKYCTTCDRIMCTVCTKTHCKLTVCLEFDSRDLTKYTTELKETFNRKLFDLQLRQLEVNSTVQNRFLDFQKVKDDMMKELDHAEDELHKSVASHFNRKRQDLTAIQDQCVNKVNEQVEIFTTKMNVYRDQLLQASNMDPVELVTKYKDIHKRVSLAGRRFESSAPYKLPKLRITPTKYNTNSHAFDSSRAMGMICEMLESPKSTPEAEIVLDS